MSNSNGLKNICVYIMVIKDEEAMNVRESSKRLRKSCGGGEVEMM